jgi:hypothetical protein
MYQGCFCRIRRHQPRLNKSSDDHSEALNLLCRLGTFSPHFGPFHFPSSDARRWPFPAIRTDLIEPAQSRACRPASLSLSSSNWSNRSSHQLRMPAPGLQLLQRHQPAQPVSRVSLRLQPQKVPTSHPQNSLSWDQLPCNPASDWAPLDVTHASALLVASRGASSPRFRPSNQIVDFST